MTSPSIQFDERGEKVQCCVCQKFYHRLDVHISTKHGINVAEYVKKYPGNPTISNAAKQRAASAQNARVIATPAHPSVAAPESEATPSAPDTDVYKIGVATLSKRTDLLIVDEKYVPRHNPQWTFDSNNMEEWEYLAMGIEDGDNIYIHGPTGCGKSGSVLELASVLNQPVLRVQLTRDFKVSQFVGRPELKVDDNGNRYTEFEYGVLPKAIQNGWWLLLDEIDQAHPDVAMALQSVLEGNPLVLTENFGEVVDPKANDRSAHFRIIATANTAGRGDESGLYSGAKVQNEATLDRYGVTIKAGYPQADTEANILTTYSGINAADAKKMVKVARTVREALANEECNCTFSTRRLIAWATKTKRLGNAPRAAKVAILWKLDADDESFVSGLIQRYFGGAV